MTRTKDEAKARATEAQKKAKEGKIKFEDLVKEYSDEPRAGERGGDLGSFPKGSMVPEFQAGLEKIKIGEISDVVESPFGFHVILRTQPTQPAMPRGTESLLFRRTEAPLPTAGGALFVCAPTNLVADQTNVTARSAASFTGTTSSAARSSLPSRASPWRARRRSSWP